MEAINFFRKGMEVDVSERYKSNETYSFAQNMFIKEHGGSIENEAGTVLCTEINGQILGSVKVKDIYILAVWRDGLSVIVEYNPSNCTWKDIIYYECLNWNYFTKVSFIHKVYNGCEDLLYFTDNKNTYSCINISRLYDHTGNCDELNINKWVSKSLVETSISKNLNSGSLKLGKYIVYRRLCDFMKNCTNWEIVDSIDITQDISDNVYTEQGGFNQINNSEEVGSYLPINASINIETNYIESYYKCIQYAILAYNTNDGSYSNVYVSDYLQFKLESTILKNQWIFNGTNHSGTITLNDLFVDKRHVGIVKAHELIDNRLFLANLRYDVDYDWAKVQQEVNKHINLFWINKKTPKIEKKFVKTYMRDEVYAFGIQGLLKDGRKTPVFHIPGRRKYNEELDNVSANQLFNTVSLYNTGVVSDKGDIASTPFTRLKPTYSGNNLQWDSMNIFQAGFNTDLIGDSNNEELWYHANTSMEVGEYNGDKIYMSSYWESKEKYPRITSCNSGYVYGLVEEEHWQLTDKSVRHHKTPDHTTAPAFDDDNIYSLLPYIDQNNVNSFISAVDSITNNQVIEWYLCDAIKEEQDKTVIDKGYTTFREANALFYGFVGDPWQDIERDEVNKDILKIYTPKTLLYSNIEKPDYLKVEYAENYRNWTRLDLNEILEPCNIPQDTWLNTEKVTLGYWTDNFAHISPSLVSGIKHNYKIEQSINIGPANGFVPNSYTQAFLFDLPDRICINYLFTCNSFTMKGDFDSLHNFNVSGGTNYTITGDPILTYSALKSKKDVHYLDSNKYVFNSLLKRTSRNICELNANCFVSPMSFTLSNRGAYAISRNSGLHRNSLNEDTIATSIEVYLRYVESDINFGLRHISTQRVYPEVNGVEDDYSGRFYRGDWLKANIPFNSPYVIPFWQSNIIYKFNNFIRKDYQSSNLKVNKWRLLTPEYFGYNPCYSFKYSGKIYFGLSQAFCKDYDSKNSFEIIYSNKSFITDGIDNNQIFLPNNTNVLPNSKGSINSLFENYNKLYALTDDSLWLIPIRPQQIQTDSNTAYIGTGEVFSIPPVRLGNGVSDITGTKNNNILKTIHGTFYVNNDLNKIYLLKESPQEISGLMGNFFNKNLEFSFEKQIRKMNSFDSLGEDFLRRLVYSFFYYDHRWNRVYFTKVDFKFKDSFLSDWDYGNDYYNFVDEQDIVFYKGANTYTLSLSTLLNQDNFVNYKDPSTYNINSNIIEFNSYTISYNLDNNFWESFHSYIPYYGLSTNEGYSTVTNNGYIWKHNISNEYNYIYYNNVPSIIEYSSVSNKNMNYILEGLYVDVKCNLQTNVFSKMCILNSYQSFGYRDIVYRAGLFPNPLSSTSIECTSRNNIYMINNFRCNSLVNNQNKEKEYPYTLPKGTNTLSYFSQDRMIDKWHKVQLIFNNQRGYYFSLNNIVTIQKEVQV